MYAINNLKKWFYSIPDIFTFLWLQLWLDFCSVQCLHSEPTRNQRDFCLCYTKPSLVHNCIAAFRTNTHWGEMFSARVSLGASYFVCLFFVLGLGLDVSHGALFPLLVGM